MLTLLRNYRREEDTQEASKKELIKKIISTSCDSSKKYQEEKKSLTGMHGRLKIIQRKELGGKEKDPNNKKVKQN